MTTTSGTVKSCTNSKAGGHAFTVTVTYPNPEPPPEEMDLTHEVDASFYADFRAAKLADKPVIVTYTPGPGNPVSGVSHA